MSNRESYGREYEAQARIITDLRDQVDTFRKRNVELELKYKDAIFYRSIADALEKHESLRDEWITFVSLLRLCEPELESRVQAEIKRYEDTSFRRF